MRKWVLFIYKINKSLESLCQKQDRYIENYALSVRGKPIEAYNEVLRRTDIKIRLINLRVIYDSFCARLNAEDSELLFSYLAGDEVEDICKRLSVSRATAFRRLGACIEKCERELLRLGYNDKRMKAEYGEYFHLVHNAKKPQRAEPEDSVCQKEMAGNIVNNGALSCKIFEKEKSRAISENRTFLRDEYNKKETREKDGRIEVTKAQTAAVIKNAGQADKNERGKDKLDKAVSGRFYQSGEFAY